MLYGREDRFQFFFVFCFLLSGSYGHFDNCGGGMGKVEDDKNDKFFFSKNGYFSFRLN